MPKNLSEVSWDRIHVILQNMTEVTNPLTDVLYAGDLLAVHTLLKSLLISLKIHVSDKLTDEISAMVHRTNLLLSNVFDESNHDAWHGMKQVKIHSHMKLIISNIKWLSISFIYLFLRFIVQNLDAIKQI